MKKSFMSISMLVVSISMLALFVCSSIAHAQGSAKFAYDKGENVETVYTLDESGLYLTPKLKYEYTKDSEGKNRMKVAFRWNVEQQQWTPYYQIIFQETEKGEVMEYAAWDSKTHSFSLNQQKSVYTKGLDNELLSYVFYKWNQATENWEIDQHILFGYYLANRPDSLN